MSNITNQYPLTGFSHRNNSSPEYLSAGYVKQQSFRSQESLDTGLVIRTKEGDQVTLTSNSFSQVEGFSYDSKGMVQTEAGQAVFNQSVREITLASGQSFSFSVEGDLSETELEDIENILKGLDGVISEMTQGDVPGALEKALGIGHFDSVSSYSADITYSRSYEMRSSAAATATRILPANEDVSEQKHVPAFASKLAGEDNTSHGKKDSVFSVFDKFFIKMLKQFENREDKQVAQAKAPINKLFKHHLNELGKHDDKIESIYTALETAMSKIDSMVEEIAGDMFKNQLAAFEEQ